MKISEILSENFQFLEVEFSIYLYRRVFVMRLFVDQNIASGYCLVVFNNMLMNPRKTRSQ